jgi:hypothetical protein
MSLAIALMILRLLKEYHGARPLVKTRGPEVNSPLLVRQAESVEETATGGMNSTSVDQAFQCLGVMARGSGEGSV